MPKRSWSALLLPALGACGPAQGPAPEPPRPLPPAPASSSVAVVAPPPPPAAPTLSPPRLVKALESHLSEVVVEHRFAHAPGFAMALADLRQPFGPCVVGNPTCTLVSFAKGTHGRTFDDVPQGLGPMGPATAPKERWLDLSSGKSHVFGLRVSKEGSHLDAIDADGKAATFLDAPGVRLARARVLELATRTVLVGESEGRPATLRVFGIETAGGKGRLTEERRLKYAVTLPRPGGTLGAQRAREAAASGDRALWPPYRVVPLLDDAGKETDGWALVAVEVVAPPPTWPEGKPHLRRGAKDGCGKMSRPLSDVSVDKRIHVVRFEGTTLVSDRVVRSDVKKDNDKDALLVAPKPGGALEIDGRLHGSDDKPKGKAGHAEPPRAPVVPGTESPTAPLTAVAAGMGYDPDAKEGLYVFSVGLDLAAVRFDDEGKPRGEAFLAGRSGTPHHVGGDWIVTDAFGVSYLTGLHEGRVLEHRGPSFARASVASKDRIHFFFDGEPGTFVHLELDAAKATFTQPEVVKRSEEHPTWVTAAVLVDGRPALLEAGRSGVFLTGLDGKSHLVTDLAEDKRLTIRAAWGGPVVVASTAKDAVGIWPLTKRTGPLPAPNEDDFMPFGWRGGEILLGPEPGAELTSPEVAKAVAEGCGVAAPTGPRRWVLGCVSATDPVRVGKSVVLRRFGG